MDTQSIEAALDDIRPALDADGFALHLKAVDDDGRVRVTLEARPGACHDCLVGDDDLVAILTTSIKNREPAVGEVILEKQGF